MPQLFESVPGEESDLIFKFNGQFALKNYDVKIVNGNRLKITSVTNELFSLMEAEVSEVEINGKIYRDPKEAQEALQKLAYSSERPFLITEDRLLDLVNKRLLQVFVLSSNTVLTEAHNGATLHIISSCNITVPQGLPPNFFINIFAKGQVSVVFVANGVNIYSPYGLLLKNNKMAAMYSDSPGNYNLLGELSNL